MIGRRLARFRRDNRAAAALLFALVLPGLLASGAITWDMGNLYVQRRSLQAAADAAAIAAVLRPADANAVARRMFERNGHPAARFALRFGTYRARRDLAPADRFVADGSPGAVSVEVTETVPILFGWRMSVNAADISVRSRAAVDPLVSFSISSRLASANPVFTDALLTPVFGSGLGLTLLDYRGIARSTISLRTLGRSLAVARGLPMATTRLADVLARPIRTAAFFNVLSWSLRQEGDAVGAAAFLKASHSSFAARTVVKPAELLAVDDDAGDLALDYPEPALAATLSVLDLIGATLSRSAVGNALAADLAVPALASAHADLLLGEPVQSATLTAVGRTGTIVQTAQARMRLRLGTRETVALAGVGATLDVPLEIVAAESNASLVSATCSSDPARREVRLAVSPGIARLSFGATGKPLAAIAPADTAEPATILRTLLIRLEAQGSATLSNGTPVAVVFRGNEIGSGTVKTVRTTQAVAGLVASLLGQTRFTLRAGPVGLSLASLLVPVKGILNGLAAPLDDILNASLGAAGIGLGEADIRVDAIVCNRVRLVG